MKVRVEQFALPLGTPLETAAGTVEERAGVLVVVSDGATTGAGEATPIAGWTESREACLGALRDAVEPLGAGEFDAALAAVEGRPAARHAVSGARLDLAARRAGVPLYRHLGAEETRRRVPVNATVGDAARPATAAAAREAVADGFRTVKVKVGARDHVEDAGRIRAVREAVGEGVSLRADANGAWDRATAERALRAFEGAGVDYVEQPLPRDDLGGLASLRGRGVGVAVDETLAAVPLSRVLDSGAADVVVLKPMALGGLDRAREAAERARRAGVTPVVTTTVDAVVARTGAVHLAASLGDLPACGLATADRLAEDLAADPAPVADGAVSVPQSAGTGVTVPEVA
jgi:o-succinylbenzoate synthase